MVEEKGGYDLVVDSSFLHGPQTSHTLFRRLNGHPVVVLRESKKEKGKEERGREREERK